jgi:hypothetical protein
MEGIIGDDADFARLRAQYENLLIHQMRDEGYVPTLDFGPLFSTEFTEDKEQYTFVLSVYGVFVGKKSAALYEGYDGHGTLFKKA